MANGISSETSVPQCCAGSFSGSELLCSRPSFGPPSGISSLRSTIPEAPRVAAMKKLNLVHRGKCRGFFVKFFCGHFPWKLKDENLRKISPKFRRIFRRSLRKISQELRSGGCGASLPYDLRCCTPPKRHERSLWCKKRPEP